MIEWRIKEGSTLPWETSASNPTFREYRCVGELTAASVTPLMARVGLVDLAGLASIFFLSCVSLLRPTDDLPQQGRTLLQPRAKLTLYFPARMSKASPEE